MRSMTGYGRSRVSCDGRELTIELKSVNHRFLDIAFRMPRTLGFLEDTIRKSLSARLSRGHVDVYITYTNTRSDARVVNVDIALVEAYMQALDQIASITQVSNDVSVLGLSRLPDVLTTTEQEDDREVITSLTTEALSLACEELVQMRTLEGERLQGDMKEKISALCSLRERIALRAPSVVADYRDRLTQRLTQLIDNSVDEQRIAQEVAIFADRAAIDEEIVRLNSHFDQILTAFESDEPVGRRLDFLVQELNREVNTIGSKASDIAITQCVVAAKTEIEKLREQVQNIE